MINSNFFQKFHKKISNFWRFWKINLKIFCEIFENNYWLQICFDLTLLNILIFFKNFTKNFKKFSRKIFIKIVKEIIKLLKKIKFYCQSSTEKRVHTNEFRKKLTLKIFFGVKFLWKFSFLKIYVMGSTQVDLLDIVHVKVGFFAVLKMCIRAHLGIFVWSTVFVQCVL